MDSNGHTLSDYFLRFVSIGKQKLSEKIQPNPKRKKIIQNWSLLLAALLIGWLAYQTTQEAVIRDWIKKNPPSLNLAGSILNTKGFQKMTHPKVIHRIIKSLPLQWDEPSSLWTSPNRDWIVIFPHHTNESPQVYLHHSKVRSIATLKTKNYPKKWTPLGASWPGLELLLQEIQNTNYPSTKPKKIKRSPSIDPRQINY